jgi:PHD/YefM family antitoxin component YafN of YafNO toxin-antitoxin module
MIEINDYQCAVLIQALDYEIYRMERNDYEKLVPDRHKEHYMRDIGNLRNMRDILMGITNKTSEDSVPSVAESEKK